MEINVFTKAYQNDLIDIFNSNCPKYFDNNDLQEFVHFLENLADQNYYVVIRDHKTIGCGGYYLDSEKKITGIAWVMFKRFSIGLLNFSKLTNKFFLFILTQIDKENQNFDILINTTQLMEKMLSSLGFVTEKTYLNGFGPNLDHLVMRRKHASHL